MKDTGGVVKLDLGNVFAEAIGPEHGLRQAELDALADRFAACSRELERRRGHDIGFMELPADEGLAADVKEKAAQLRDGRCRNFVVCGIGGSALGATAIHAALNHPHHNLLPEGHPARLGAPRLLVLDNVDPACMDAAVDVFRDDLEGTFFNVITKSGSTAETMSQFLFVREMLQKAGLDPAEQIILTTDPRPEKSLLRRIAERDGYYALPVPPNVGGRFSVLSAVGLLSAAVGGVDIDLMLEGAAGKDGRCRSHVLADNPAGLYAAVLYLLYQKGKPITVLMPYANNLRRLADWYCQLWAESLGKRDGLQKKDLFIGPTPVGAVGVTDQHSVMQLFQDGAFDKVVTLIEVDDLRPGAREDGLPIARGETEPELAYLARSTFDRLFGAELAATRCALRDKHRPNLTLTVPQVDARVLGALFMFFEYAVTFSGCFYGVDAFDQPGVELGKQYTYGLMGREGFQAPQV